MYNWCVRFHRLSTNSNPQLTSRQLFGNSLAGFRHDFPTHLDSFSEITNQLLGSVESLVYDRTIFAIFAPFLAPAINETVVQEMQKGGYSQIKNHLGLRASSIATIAPLKACAICMQDDATSSGMAWWHLEHQLPTVRLCPKHDQYLLMATQEFHAKGLNGWFFPTDLQSSHWHITPVLDEPSTIKLRNLTAWSLLLTKFHDRPFDSELLRLTYHLRAKSIGLSSIDGTMNFNKVRLAFRESYACLENLSGFSFIRETIHDHGGFIREILFKRGIHKHPLRHVIMLEFLFGDPTIFLTEYEHVLSASTGLNKQDVWIELTDSRNPLKLLVTDAGYSANAAARQLNIPAHQAISFLKKEGIEYKLRHRVLDQRKEEMLITLLNAGEERDEIASRLGIPRSFVIDYVAKYPDLQNSWRKALQQNLIETHRATFLEFVTDNPNLPTNKIRLDSSSSFQWLQRNDKNWLKHNLQGMWQNSDEKPV